MITIKDVEHVAKLARLELTEDEKEMYTKQLSDVLKHVDEADVLYKESYDALSKDYNIMYTGYIWNQGENDEKYGKNQNNTIHDEATY